MCLAGFAATGAAVSGRAACVAITTAEVADSWAPEAEAVTFLRDNRLRGRLLTWFNYGEMAIWHLAPGMRVSYDGRRETVYSEAVQGAHGRFYKGLDPGYAGRIGADYVWLPRRLPVVDRLEREGWTAVFSGSRSTVLARRAGAYVRPEPWTGPRCFPGP
jgi:hypothetical protein